MSLFEYLLYREVSGAFIDLESYMLYSLNYWPAFSSASRNKEVALKFAGVEKPMIFEIYGTTNNAVLTKVMMRPGWSFYLSEEEVLLLPLFCFQVAKIEQSEVSG